MTPVGFILLLICALGLLAVPRHLAAVPLLCGYLYMTVGQSLSVGGLNLYAIRLLILVGVVRIFVRGEKPPTPFSFLDRSILAWGFVALFTSVFHEEPVQMFINRGGLVLNQVGIYLLFRCFIQSSADAYSAFRWSIVCLVPLALLLGLERMTYRNPFAILGGVPELAAQREGRFRAQGPFGNPIDAGVAGAFVVPFAIILWHRSRALSLLGLTVALAMILLSASSTPVSALGVIALGLYLWQMRQYLRTLVWAGISAFIGLALVMKAPVYFLIARIDFAGGSTGWHRAALIEAAIVNFKEWWLVGSDFTRHWMPYGLEGNPNHADITNHFIMNGVMGGVPMLVCLVITIVAAFQGAAKIYRDAEGRDQERLFIAWSLGVALFAHAVTFLGVSYYDQLLGFWYLHLALIACLAGDPVSSPAPATASVEEPERIPTFLDSALPHST